MEFIRMPRASENMVEGTVGLWLIEEGSDAAAGAPVVEIITEKAQFELECERGGTLAKVFAPPRSTVPIGYVLGVLTDVGEDVDIDAVSKENEALIARHLRTAVGDLSVNSAMPEHRKDAGRVSATPRAKKLAAVNNIDLAVVRDKLGVSGIIEESHVKKFIEGLQ